MPPEPKRHWRQLGDSRFIGVWTLPNGEDLTVTIESVQTEIITLEESKAKEHRVMNLLGHKPMILNVTNSKSIDRLYGPYVEDWAGKQITLFGSTTELEGEHVDCLRVRPSIPLQAKPPLSNARLAKALVQVKSGQYTLAALRAKFALTADQESAITFHTSKAS